jgi:radical SAM enzyme (TIGR01210 family)
VTAGAEDRRIRSQRARRPVVDLWRPLSVECEPERTRRGTVETLTVFLAGAECPFTCVFCDLWRFTVEEPTPDGAIPAQLERALEDAGDLPRGSTIKLYNASNFFDRRAVPVRDLPAIAGMLAGFERVVVECHPRLVDEGVVAFSDMVGGGLEVAMGLETVHPGALPRLNKKMSREEYDRAAAALESHGIPHRAFVLLGTPFVPHRESVDWTIISAAYALDRGAEMVSIIPVRGGNGELERLAADGLFQPPSLGDAEEALQRALALPGTGVVQLDVWDVERLSACDDCFVARRERLRHMNLTGEILPYIHCPSCERG